MYVTSNHGKDQFKLKKFETLKSAQPPETSMLQPNHLYTTEGYKQGYMYPSLGSLRWLLAAKLIQHAKLFFIFN